jgi:hypothetical protein
LKILHQLSKEVPTQDEIVKHIRLTSYKSGIRLNIV